LERIWIKLDKDARDDIDNSQAMADSAVHASFTIFINGLLWFICIFSLVFSSSLKYFPFTPVLLVLSVLCFSLAYGVYRLSLSTQWQFGELVKSMFDAYRSKIDQDILEVLDEVIKGPIDGILSPQTQEALRQYQKTQGLPQTGQLDGVTKEHVLAQRSGAASGSTAGG
jgi:peptidoglycan hydrolase-like protein with peptidoglycan-binding domain